MNWKKYIKIKKTDKYNKTREILKKLKSWIRKKVFLALT